MEQYHTLKFQGEGLPSRVFGVVALLIAVGFALRLMLALNMKGLLIGGGLIVVVLLYATRIIRYVSFENNHLVAKYFYGKKKIVLYEDIKCVYKNREGVASIFVYVIKTKEGIKPKKVTFFCKDEEFEKLKLFLEERGVKDVSERPHIMGEKM